MSLGAAPPRIAIVGGGIAGTLCSLVLKNRGLTPVIIDQGVTGLGGRLRRGGAQFLRATDPRLQSVMSMLQGAKLIQPWRARFGMLGSMGGGFLPSSIVASGMMSGRRRTTSGNSSSSGILGLTRADPASNNDNNPTAATDTGDFCNFVQDSEMSPTYVGVPEMMDLCPQIASLADISTVSGTKVVGASMAVEGGWILDLDDSSSNNKQTEQPKQQQHFDALIVASHNPALASTVVQSIVDAELSAGGYSSVEEVLESNPATDTNTSNMLPLVLKRLSTLSQHLQQVRDEGRLPLFTVQSTYPMGFSDSIPFDAVSVPGSQYIQFMAREGSKPDKLGTDADVWTAITTSHLAAQVLENDSDENDLVSIEAKEDYIQKVIIGEMANLLSHYFDGDPSKVPLPIAVQVKCWGAALCGKGLELHEDSITLSSWRLGICGDFIRQSSAYSTPWEAAALSGLEAGERMTSLLANWDSTAAATTTT